MPEKQKNKSKEIHFSKKVPPPELIFSLQNLGVMLKSGLSIQDALGVIGSQAQHYLLKETYAKILEDIDSGLSLARAFQKYPQVFSPLVISIVNAGEQGGTLEKNLAYLGSYLKSNYELKKKIRGAMFYPLIILSLTGVEMLAVVFFILPQLEAFFSSLPNPSFVTQFILGFGKFMRGNSLYLFIGLIFISIGLYLFVKTERGKYTKDWLALKIPIFKKLNKESILANFARTFGILLQSGLPIYNALSISAETINNRLYNKALLDIKSRVLAGTTVADSMAIYVKYFPKIFTKMVEVGERAGALENNLISMHEYYAEDVKDMSNNLATLIEPILLIFVGLVVALLAVSIILPLYQTVSGLQA